MKKMYLRICALFIAVFVFAAIGKSQVTLSITAFTNINCNGGSNGSATATRSGGVGPFTYVWAPTGGTNATASGLSSGSYTCTVTDNNDMSTATATVTLTQPLAITAVMSSNPASCGNPNGNAHATVSGGVPPYTYQWAPSGGTGSTAFNLLPGTYTCTIYDSNGCMITPTVVVGNLAGPTATISVVNVSCYGGANGCVTVVPSGGTSPYAYNWAPMFASSSTVCGLTAGGYTVTVTDANGCTATAFNVITQPAPLTATTAVNNGCTPCTGSATITPTGGNSPYTFAWTPNVSNTSSANNLCAGNYSVLITDVNGCNITHTFAITNLSATISQIDNYCYGGNSGSATVVASGGTGPYTYLWTPGNATTATANNLSAGSYTCTITDACSNVITRTVTITQPSQLIASIQTITNASCTQCNGSLTAACSGGMGPYIYSWTPVGNTATISNLCPGNYTLTVSDMNGCVAVTSGAVQQAGAFTASLSIVNSGCTACTGTATANTNGGIAPFSYSWSNAATTQFVQNLCAGNYSVTVTDSAGCSSVAAGVVNTNTTFIATATSTPANCSYTNGTGTISITGGVTPYTYLWQPVNATNATESLPPGIYHVIVGDASGCFTSVYDTIQGPPNLYGYITTTQTNCTTINGRAVFHTSGGVPPYTYLWSNNTTNDTASGLPGGSYSVTVTDSHGCNASGSTVIYTACDNVVAGKIYHDPNLNCVFDSGDMPSSTYVYAVPGNYGTTTDAQGNYALHIPIPGTFTIYASTGLMEPAHCPASGNYVHTFSSTGDTLFNADFATHTLSYQDISVWITSGPARPGFPVTYTLTYYNSGNVNVNNVVLTFNHDPMLTFSSSSVTPATYNSPTATWNLGALAPGQSGSLNIILTVPANAVIGNVLCGNADIMPVSGDMYVPNNYATDCRIIQGSFDPNEKRMNSATHNPIAGTIAQNDSLLTYTIHFQNTGTDTAFDIVLVDTLSQYVNPVTLVPGPSSHPYQFEMVNGVMKFNFYNILLPDSNRDEPNSHGWVSYQVKTKPNLIAGTVINNTAGIYFDYNAPVFTNTTSDTLVSPLLVMNQGESGKVMVYPNPFDESTALVLPASVSGKQNEMVLTGPEGRVIRKETISAGNSFVIERGNLEAGIYFCTVYSEGKIVGVTKLIVR